MAPKTTTPSRPVDKVKAFKDLASKRTQRVLDAISVLENCANKTSYTYTAEQSKAILEAVAQGFASLKASFEAGGKAKSGNRFTV